MHILTRIVGILLIWSLSGCSSKPEPKPETKPDQKQSENAIHGLDEEVVVSEEKEDFTGNVAEATGKAEMETIAEPDAAEVAEYRTGEPGWIEVSDSRIFSNSVSPDKAKQELLQILRNEAVSRKVHANIEVTSLLTDVMSEVEGEAREQTAWAGFFKTTVSGVITQEEILSDQLIPLEGKENYEKKMTLKAHVEPVQGQRDPGFYVDVQLDNNLLKAGDELAFSITPSKDCYLYVFNLMADQNILLMFPNDYMKDNFVPAVERIQIPDPGIRNYAKFVVAPMPGEELITAESVYIVCSREEVPMIKGLMKIGTSMPVFSANSQSFIKLQRWLSNIPLDQRVEKNLIYHVSKN